VAAVVDRARDLAGGVWSTGQETWPAASGRCDGGVPHWTWQRSRTGLRGPWTAVASWAYPGLIRAGRALLSTRFQGLPAGLFGFLTSFVVTFCFPRFLCDFSRFFLVPWFFYGFCLNFCSDFLVLFSKLFKFESLFIFYFCSNRIFVQVQILF
jgi:hypothetical protein